MAATTTGQAADQAFEIGVRAAAVGALAAIGALYWLGLISPLSAVVALVLLFPTYLLVVAALLSKWLGLGKDASDLRPVTRSQDANGRWWQ